jgi:hypothetical protein
VLNATYQTLINNGWLNPEEHNVKRIMADMEMTLKAFTLLEEGSRV